jgi:hypothetical protein
VPGSVPDFALPTGARLKQTYQQAGGAGGPVELWTSGAVGSARIDYHVDGTTCLPLRQVAFQGTFFPPTDFLAGMSEYNVDTTARPAASAFDPKAIGAPTCTSGATSTPRIEGRSRAPGQQPSPVQPVTVGISGSTVGSVYYTGRVF